MTHIMAQGRILVVDDEVDLLEILSEFLTDKGFTVVTAHDGVEALQTLEKSPAFDLVLSDINMPRMKGFELINQVRKKYPDTKCSLITAYDVNSYIDLAKQYNVGNIFSKTSPFNFPDFLVHVSRLVSGEIFGLEKYFAPAHTIQGIMITNANQIEDAIERIYSAIKDMPKSHKIKTALRELVVNAVYYGAKNEDGAHKDSWKTDMPLESDEYVFITYAFDTEKIGISISDQKGRLKKADVLFWLERNIARDPTTGYVKSINDEHGRGLFISREFIDSLIINVKPGARTEIILLNYNEHKYHGFKPLIINEV
ncbi:MAG: hypothetical protein A2268_11515 [Candidatus Raymondbacteria bacterium RifOxyA12_full_50_37]|uniref:Response regulatory domain-containing protein n=1 Tax=Candidatus Raymondbacteria bacterium RIFOXYD12_FULL_49_13 TaxID=1817890 RepID=A0A1F7FAC7_UNCRA|nr:MAG: hypothetical protein A2268_11515 [Candidatus Raymondbacteria bacterium RifOxyA12_full_50_37]OGJ92396.1 MAG: hypothetical protein A2248_10640 [Candidatus Raymondbacteria bacterium RIFOXYA2_FULL_49_16]OGJ99377.1 MAG: hypothetical protein A2453_13700 [Candidatus Raymondbacteria bacterium RIFOXYC2_FULL_50_21]OGK03610.1 MAG: hypothetical protein A2519_02420 [Candidatus Raymondbacteria bacterium RIFOXYD12_FULL_49_13]OGP44289.1 MAG: hypothetical protein A2324_05030 [Candidatus Raymondbacteria 